MLSENVLDAVSDRFHKYNAIQPHKLYSLRRIG